MMNIANKTKRSTSANLGTFSTVVKWNDQTTTSSTMLNCSNSDVVSYTNKNYVNKKGFLSLNKLSVYKQ